MQKIIKLANPVPRNSRTKVPCENYRLLKPSHWRRIFLYPLISKGHSPNPLVRYKWCPSALWLCAVIRRFPGNKPREWCQKLTFWRAWQIWTWMVSRPLRYCTFSKLTIHWSVLLIEMCLRDQLLTYVRVNRGKWLRAPVNIKEADKDLLWKVHDPALALFYAHRLWMNYIFAVLLLVSCMSTYSILLPFVFSQVLFRVKSQNTSQQKTGIQQKTSLGFITIPSMNYAYIQLTLIFLWGWHAETLVRHNPP